MSAPQYIIISHQDSERLAQEVNERLADGWELQGGVSVAQSVYLNRNDDSCYDNTFAQAMTRKP